MSARNDNVIFKPVGEKLGMKLCGNAVGYNVHHSSRRGQSTKKDLQNYSSRKIYFLLLNIVHLIVGIKYT